MTHDARRPARGQARTAGDSGGGAVRAPGAPDGGATCTAGAARAGVARIRGAARPGVARGVTSVLPLVLLATLTLLATGVHAPAAAGNARLSWSADEQVARIDQIPDNPVQVHLTIDGEEPADSLGFRLRWATSDLGAAVRVVGLRAAGTHPTDLTNRPADAAASNGSFRPLERILSHPDYLREIGIDTPQGFVRYPLVLDLEITGATAMRLQVHGVSAKVGGGHVVQLGNPTVSAGGGWMLTLPPQLTEAKRILNRGVIRSILTFEGIDLDRVVRLRLIDSMDRFVYPGRISAQSAEAIEVVFTTKVAAEGHCALELGFPDGLTVTLPGAVESKPLDYRQPGDTNMGIIPGRDD